LISLIILSPPCTAGNEFFGGHLPLLDVAPATTESDVLCGVGSSPGKRGTVVEMGLRVLYLINWRSFQVPVVPFHYLHR
jgi:hypothetical protein